MSSTQDRKKIIGSRLKQLRDKAGLLQEEAADKLGVTRASLSNYEIGRATPKPDFVAEAVALYKTNTDYILGYTENPDPVNNTEAEFDKDLISLSDDELIEKYEGLFGDEAVEEKAFRRILAYLRSEKRLKE